MTGYSQDSISIRDNWELDAKDKENFTLILSDKKRSISETLAANRVKRFTREK